MDQNLKTDAVTLTCTNGGGAPQKYVTTAVPATNASNPATTPRR